jgi:hypothetical protein
MELSLPWGGVVHLAPRHLRDDPFCLGVLLLWNRLLIMSNVREVLPMERFRIRACGEMPLAD